MTQTAQILKHMQSGKTITPAEAMADYGIYRLASRIYDIERMGYTVRRETASGLNREGSIVRWREYWLEDNA
jgi:hypothetical protein